MSYTKVTDRPHLGYSLVEVSKPVLSEVEKAVGAEGLVPDGRHPVPLSLTGRGSPGGQGDRDQDGRAGHQVGRLQ